MLSSFLGFFTAPVFPDNEPKSRTSRNVFVMLKVLLVVMVPVLIATAVRGYLFTSGVGTLYFTVVLIVILVIARLGFAYTASWMFVISEATMVISMAVPRGGTLSSLYGGVMTSILIAGTLLGLRAAFITIGIGAVAGGMMLWADSNGILPPPLEAWTPFMSYVIELAFFFITAGIIFIGNRSVSEYMQELESESTHRQELNEQLEQAMQAERESKERLQTTVADYMTFTQNVATGDLRSRLALNDEHDESDDLHHLGESLNVMAENLAVLTRQTQRATEQISESSQELLAMTTQQSASVVEQEAAVAQTTATVTEVKSTVQLSAERAKSVADASQDAVMVMEAGEESVTKAIDGMNRVQGRVQDIAENILALSERTQQIGEIIETVDNIAYQSKLLALNAAIEAARAGEEGRGFSVVAMEVRQLAEESQRATAHIGDILYEIQQATNSAVMVTEEGIKETAEGMHLAGDAGAAIRELGRVIELTSRSVQQISASTQQQSEGMSQLLDAIETIRSVSSQTVASTNQARESAQMLSDLAFTMEETIDRYES